MIYAILSTYVRLAQAVFYRRIEVVGRERIPDAVPLLLVGNHVNSLMDPLLVAGPSGRVVSLTAKSTLFNMPVLGSVMRAASVIPLHRRQDVSKGADPARNQDSLSEIRRRLAEGGAIILFPEGRSHSEPAMSRFKHGAARLALDYLEEGDVGGLHIQPFGLYYSSKGGFRSRVLLEFGAPLSVAEWRRANPDARVSMLTKELRERVEALTLNFDDAREAELLSWAAEIVETQAEMPAVLGERGPTLFSRARLISRLQAGRRVVTNLEADEAGPGPGLGGASDLSAQARARVARLDELEQEITDYRGRLAQLGIRPREVFIPLDVARAIFFVLREFELLLLGLPMAAWGALNHAIPVAITQRLASRITEEEDQFASNAVFLGFLFFPAFYVLVILLAMAFLPAVWALLYALLLPFSGYYLVLYRDRAGGSWQRSRTFLRFLRDREEQADLAARGRGIVEKVRALAAELETGEEGSRLDRESLESKDEGLGRDGR